MKGFVIYTVKYGDTIQSIAASFQLSSWQQIAALNNLTYPFIDDSIVGVSERNPDIRYIGDTLLVPADYDQLPSKINNAELAKLAYGCDLDITIKTDGEMNGNGTANIENSRELRDNGKGDLAIAEGVDNLKQAVILRLTTPKGTLPLHPDYGSDFLQLLGRPRTNKQIVKIKLEVESCLKSDFRISKVNDIQILTTESGGAVLSCDIIPIEPYSSFRFENEFPIIS